jgi:hypothetical protein
VLVITASYTLEPIFACLSKRRQYGQYAHLEWVTNGALQLHRLAHEQHSHSSWSQCETEYPINNAEAVLASLDISDSTHPVLAS